MASVSCWLCGAVVAAVADAVCLPIHYAPITIFCCLLHSMSVQIDDGRQTNCADFHGNVQPNTETILFSGNIFFSIDWSNESLQFSRKLTQKTRCTRAQRANSQKAEQWFEKQRERSAHQFRCVFLGGNVQFVIWTSRFWLRPNPNACVCGWESHYTLINLQCLVPLFFLSDAFEIMTNDNEVDFFFYFRLIIFFLLIMKRWIGWLRLSLHNVLTTKSHTFCCLT